uniref:Uncharacterized protein n=1 Tax=Sus scrofa TaxID=9823 RepID=A0A8D0NJD4_PIG
MIKGLLLEVEGIQSCCHIEKAALGHADRARPDTAGCLVDTQFTDIVGPGDGVPLGQHHGVAAGGRRPQWRVQQPGRGLGGQRLEHRGVHSPQVLKEPLHHLVPMTVVVLQGHFGDLKHRTELVRGMGGGAGGRDPGAVRPGKKEPRPGSTAPNRKLSCPKPLLIKRSGLFFRRCRCRQALNHLLGHAGPERELSWSTT